MLYGQKLIREKILLAIITVLLAKVFKDKPLFSACWYQKFNPVAITTT